MENLKELAREVFEERSKLIKRPKQQEKKIVETQVRNIINIFKASNEAKYYPLLIDRIALMKDDYKEEIKIKVFSRGNRISKDDLYHADLKDVVAAIEEVEIPKEYCESIIHYFGSTLGKYFRTSTIVDIGVYRIKLRDVTEKVTICEKTEEQ